MLDVLPCKKADACMYAHTNTQDATACRWISFCQKIDLLWNKQCMCVSCCTPVMGHVDKVNFNSTHNHKPVGPGKWQWMRKRENVHSSTAFPPVYVCVLTAVSVFSDTHTLRVCMYVSGSVFAVWIQLSGWCVKSLTASLWLVRTGRQHHPGEGEKRTETWDRPGLPLGRPMSIQLLGGGTVRGVAAVSFNEPLLLSSAFNLQGCPAFHTHTHTQFEAVLFLAGVSPEEFLIVKLICHLPLIRPSHLGR